LGQRIDQHGCDRLRHYFVLSCSRVVCEYDSKKGTVAGFGSRP
jgi:hypothetical protein